MRKSKASEQAAQGFNPKDFFEALEEMAKEKGIGREELIENIKTAMRTAAKKAVEGPNKESKNKKVTKEEDAEHYLVEIKPEDGTFKIAYRKDVVKDVTDALKEISVDDARKYNENATVGDKVEIPADPKEFGRIAAQAAKHMIRQGVREAEKSNQLKEFEGKNHEILSAEVISDDGKKALLRINNYEATLPEKERVAGEVFKEGSSIKVYVVNVLSSEKGPRIEISRTHPNLVRRLCELNIPDVTNGTVEIKSQAREAGSRTKIAVWSKDPNVDPVGACIGKNGEYVNKIVQELQGEKIDVIPYSDDPQEYIAKALAPAQVVAVEILNEEEKSCRAIVPDSQLSLAIGNKGQNARLAARLTGWKIDIHPQSGKLEDTAVPKTGNAFAQLDSSLFSDN